MTTVLSVLLASWNHFETRALKQVTRSNRGGVVETIVPCLLRANRERVTYHVWLCGLVWKLPFSYPNADWPYPIRTSGPTVSGTIPYVYQDEEDTVGLIE